MQRIIRNLSRLTQPEIKEDYFSRKEYLRHFKEISPATASRDLKNAFENRLLEKIGDKNTTRYKYVNNTNEKI